MVRCRYCKAEIRWARTEKGHWLLLDPEPYTGDNPDGLFVLRNNVAVAVPVGAFDDEPRYTSHFESCPHGPLRMP